MKELHIGDEIACKITGKIVDFNDHGAPMIFADAAGGMCGGEIVITLPDAIIAEDEKKVHLLLVAAETKAVSIIKDLTRDEAEKMAHKLSKSDEIALWNARRNNAYTTFVIWMNIHVENRALIDNKPISIPTVEGWRPRYRRMEELPTYVSTLVIGHMIQCESYFDTGVLLLIAEDTMGPMPISDFSHIEIID